MVVRSLLPHVFMQLSHILHYTTLQKFATRVSGTVLEKIKIISSFVVLLSNIRRLFIGIIDSSGFKLSTNASQYYNDKVKPTQEEISKIINWDRGTISDR